MKVGIDARFITSIPRRGIGSYSINLLINLLKYSKDIQYYLYIYHSDIENIIPVAQNIHIRRLVAPIYPIWEQVVLPIAVHKDKLDVLHCLGNTAPIILFGKTKLLLTLHDVMYLQSGQFIPKPVSTYQKIGRFYRSIVVPIVARKAKYIFTVSEYSKLDIINLIPGAIIDRVVVTYEGCDPLYETLEYRLKTPEIPFILSLGANDPRKNTLFLVNSFLKLIEDVSITHNLIIVGYKNWKNSSAHKAAIQSGVSHRIIFLPFISIEELANLYRSASLFVYPSLYEGFGIPLLEAFNSGCPVLASNTTSIPEVGAEGAVYFSPNNSNELVEKMSMILKDDSLQNSLSQKGKIRASRFNWEKIAKDTIKIYKKII
jgi:glycosyltransferase involved in cell wall biosynthesis